MGASKFDFEQLYKKEMFLFRRTEQKIRILKKQNAQHRCNNTEAFYRLKMNWSHLSVASISTSNKV